MTKEERNIQWLIQCEERIDRYDCTKGVRYKYTPCKIYAREVVERFCRMFDTKNCYQDYSPKAVSFGDRTISSIYLPYGLKKLDSWFGKEIRKLISGESEFQKEEMIMYIRTCPHLHPIIKNNLYYNLIDGLEWQSVKKNMGEEDTKNYY